MWVVMVVWGFDRLACQGLKMVGIKMLEDDCVHPSVPGVFGLGHAYLYLLVLTWRFWQNRPFSVATTLVSVPGRETCALQMPKSRDVEKISAVHVNISRLSDSDSTLDKTEYC